MEGYPADENQAATYMNRIIEKEIMSTLEQHLWIHRCFKIRPQGEASLYIWKGLKRLLFCNIVLSWYSCCKLLIPTFSNNPPDYRFFNASLASLNSNFTLSEIKLSLIYNTCNCLKVNKKILLSHLIFRRTLALSGVITLRILRWCRQTKHE